MAAAMSLKVVIDTWVIFRHEGPRRPVALVVQDQREGSGFECLHLPIVTSLSTFKSCPVCSTKSYKRPTEEISGARLTRSLSVVLYFLLTRGLGYKNDKVLSSKAKFHLIFLLKSTLLIYPKPFQKKKIQYSYFYLSQSFSL